MSALTVDELLAGSAVTHRVDLPAELAPPGTAGGHVVLRPLVLADIARLRRAGGDSADLASALMVQQAMVEPRLTLDQVHQLPAGLVEFLLAEVNRVSGISLTGDELQDAVHAPLARACFVLAREFGWTPERCATLTVGQLLVYLEMLARGERPTP